MTPAHSRQPRAHPTDAGLDIRAMHNAVIPPHWSERILTGVHVELPPGTAGMLVSKSGLNVNHDITTTGLIDEGYDGAIIVKMHNHGRKPFVVHAGDKITQLVVVPVLYEGVEIVDKIDGGERGENGFGSSGK